VGGIDQPHHRLRDPLGAQVVGIYDRLGAAHVTVRQPDAGVIDDLKEAGERIEAGENKIKRREAGWDERRIEEDDEDGEDDDAEAAPRKTGVSAAAFNAFVTLFSVLKSRFARRSR
jgi:hypothetical protein